MRENNKKLAQGVLKKVLRAVVLLRVIRSLKNEAHLFEKFVSTTRIEIRDLRPRRLQEPKGVHVDAPRRFSDS
jgi:hypothetical protein